jgi:aryl carrier-like protein
MIKRLLLDRVNRLSAEQRKLLAEQLINGEGAGRKGSGQLVAYVKGNTRIDLEALKAHIGQYLPGYMIPGAIVQLDNFPRLPNGKINTDALPSPQTRSAPAGAGQGTAGQFENILIEIWEDVLGVKPVGLNDNFFEIGGDSILSIQIVAKARSRGLEFAANQLFLHQTIKELANQIDQTGQALKHAATASGDQSESINFSSTGLST